MNEIKFLYIKFETVIIYRSRPNKALLIGFNEKSLSYFGIGLNFGNTNEP